jgi:NAD kinase
MDYEKIILVTRKTRLEGLVERFNTKGQAKFYLEHSGDNFEFYEHEHETYYAAVNHLRAAFQGLLKFQELERGFLPNYMFSDSDIVITVGIDGLVVNTAKYLNGQPLIAVNPDPAHIDGILLPFTVQQAAQAVHRVLKDQVQVRLITMAEARLNDGQSLVAFNDLFIGVRSHVSARYSIQIGQQEEHHSSSGIIVSTGVGSTGWLSSLFNMANGMAIGFSDEVHTNQPIPPVKLNWEAEQLVFVVREPFTSKTSGASVVCGRITPDLPLVLRSEMPEGGVIFSDGVESDFLTFNAGSSATIGIAPRKTNLVVG